MELMWITLATFRDGSLYQYRWFRDARGCGLEYRIHSPNVGRTCDAPKETP